MEQAERINMTDFGHLPLPCEMADFYTAHSFTEPLLMLALVLYLSSNCCNKGYMQQDTLLYWIPSCVVAKQRLTSLDICLITHKV